MTIFPPTLTLRPSKRQTEMAPGPRYRAGYEAMKRWTATKFSGRTRRTMAWSLATAISLFGLAWLVVAQEPSERSFQAYPLRHGQAADIEPRLKEVLADQPGVEVVIDRSANRLLVQG